MGRSALIALVLSMLGPRPTAALGTPAAAVIFLHGSGDTGAGADRMMQSVSDGRFAAELAKHKVDVVYPTAPPIPYTIAQGQVMNVWFDRKSLSPKAAEQEASIAASCARVEAAADRLVARGVPASRIAVGGFSMGGGQALQVALRSRRRFAGVFALSSYLCDGAAVYPRLASAQERLAAAASDDADAALLSLPVFMRHGADDKFILPAWGAATSAKLAALGLAVDAGAPVPGLGHGMADDEVEELTAWLLRLLAAKPPT